MKFVARGFMVGNLYNGNLKLLQYILCDTSIWFLFKRHGYFWISKMGFQGILDWDGFLGGDTYTGIRITDETT